MVDFLQTNKDLLDGGLSNRGRKDLEKMRITLGKSFYVFDDVYDEQTNPNGTVNLGVADNSLCRKELIDFFTSPGRLAFNAQDLTYADGFYASQRVIDAVTAFYNTCPEGLYTRETWTPPVHKVESSHVFLGNGATQLLEAAFWELLDEGQGVLVHAPYYNALDDDLPLRAKVQIVPVDMYVPDMTTKTTIQSALSPDVCVGQHDRALQRAKEQNIHVGALFVCNPHNPTGAIYPRATMVALAAFAAKHELHLVVDEIYARSVFLSRDMPETAPFDSILRIDTQAEAGLHPGRVHVISSASKDFGLNGFRLGIFISQRNPNLLAAMFANSRFAITPSPSGQLFASLINNQEYLSQYLSENRSRLAKTHNWVTAFLQHHGIPYIGSNAALFLMMDLRRFLFTETQGATQQLNMNGDGSADDPPSYNSLIYTAPRLTSSEKMQAIADRVQEEALTKHFLCHHIFLAPGAQYHFPIAGFFRLTFSIEAKALQVGLSRMEKALGLQSWIASQPLPDY